MVLVEIAVNRRHLPLSESVVERVVDLRGGETEPRGRVAVDDDIAFDPVLLLIAVEVENDAALLQLLKELRRPFIELRRVVRLQRVLIQRVALSAADAQILDRLYEQARAGDLAQFAPQPRHDLAGGLRALRQRLEL